MTRPLLLLDVDGVLNPFDAVRCPSGFAEHDLFPDEEPVRVNPGHGAWITELGDVYDVAWATFWNENANRLLVPVLGIAPLPILTMPSAPCHPSAKVPLIAEFCRDRPAVWIDDAQTPEALTWSGNRTEPTLLIPIDPAVGLTRHSVDQALAWAGDL